MALTWDDAKASGASSGLWDRGYNSTDYLYGANGGKLDFRVYASHHDIDDANQKFDCTVYVFARKANGYSSTNDFTITFYYDGNTYTTKVNKTLPSSGKAVWMASHTFKGLTMDRSGSSGTMGAKVVGASGTSDASGTWTITKTIKFNNGSMDATITGRTTTSLTAKLNNMVTNRGISSYVRPRYKLSSASDYTNRDLTKIADDSTTTSLSETFSGLTPCTYYNLQMCIGMRNLNPSDDLSYNLFLFSNKKFGVSGYTNAKVAAEPTVANKVYNGSAQTGVSGGTGVTLGGTRSATNVGDYEATATPTMQYNWTSAGVAQSSKTVKKYPWKITPKGMTASNMTVTLGASSYSYDGAAKKPSVTVKDNARGVNLVNGTDYTVSYPSDVTNAGTKTITITGKGNYSGSFTVTYSIVAKGMTASNMTTTLSAASYTYDGTAKKPTVTVKDNARNVNLTNGTDYTVTYPSDVTNVGTKTITIKGKGNYSGSFTKTYNIAARNISNATMTLDPSVVDYYGGVNQPAPIVKDLNKTLTNGTDYTVAYSNNTNAGTGKATITGKGNYTGTKSANFTIRPRAISGNVSITLSETSYVFNATARKPKVTAKDIARNVTLVENTDYTVAYSNNVNAGTATVTVTGKGNYTGTGTATFTIQKLSIADSTVVASISPTTYVFDGTAKKPKVSIYRGASTNVLSEGTNYTVAYSNNTNVGTGTVTISGIGNYTSSRKINFTISAKSISDSSITVTLSATSYTYDGTAKTPTITVKDTARNATLTTDDWSASYSNNTNAGTGKVTITGKGNYGGTRTATFVINKAASKLTVTPMSVEVKTKKTATATFTKIGDGVVTVNSSNTALATVAVTGNTITITGIKKGAATITVNCPATTNYAASQKTIAVTVIPSVCVRYGDKETDTIFYGDKPIVAIFYGDKEIV